MTRTLRFHSDDTRATKRSIPRKREPNRLVSPLLWLAFCCAFWWAPFSAQAQISLYVTNSGNSSSAGGLLKIQPDGSVSVLVSGTGVPPFFYGPNSVAYNPATGFLYVGALHTLYRVSLDGTVSVLATSANGYGAANALSVDAAGTLYVADVNGGGIDGTGFVPVQLLTFTPSGVESTIALPGFGTPSGIAVDSVGNLYVSDLFAGRIVKITPAGANSTFVSTGLLDPSGLAFDSSDNLYVANASSFLPTIVKITPSGSISTFANLGSIFASTGPSAIAFDTNGNLFADSYGSSTIVKITPAGSISTFVTSAAIVNPVGLTFAPTNTSVPEPAATTMVIALAGFVIGWRRRRSTRRD